MPPMTGRVIAGRYNLQHPIGRGAMGVVWRARDQILDRDVAVKEVVISSLIGEEERRNAYQRTLREARTAARLSHRGLVAVYDVAEEDGRPWIVMELVPSRSLDQVLTVEGRLPPLRVARIGQQLLSALAAAHIAGVLHRDVKPSNVLIATDRTGTGWDERAVLTDFGIAQFEGDPRLTQTGMVMGSPGFTAPERIRGGDATGSSDLWSLGATLYAAVEGRGPYEQRGGAITTMSAIINEDAPVAAHAGRLAPVIGALLRRDPSDRPTAPAAARMFAYVLPLLSDSDPEPPGPAHPPTIMSQARPAAAARALGSASASPASASPAPSLPAARELTAPAAIAAAPPAVAATTPEDRGSAVARPAAGRSAEAEDAAVQPSAPAKRQPPAEAPEAEPELDSATEAGHEEPDANGSDAVGEAKAADQEASGEAAEETAPKPAPGTRAGSESEASGVAVAGAAAAEAGAEAAVAAVEADVRADDDADSTPDAAAASADSADPADSADDVVSPDDTVSAVDVASAVEASQPPAGAEDAGVPVAAEAVVKAQERGKAGGDQSGAGNTVIDPTAARVSQQPKPKPAPSFTAAKPGERAPTPTFSAARPDQPGTVKRAPQAAHGSAQSSVAQSSPPPSYWGASQGAAAPGGQWSAAAPSEGGGATPQYGPYSGASVPAPGIGGQYAGPSQAYPDLAAQYAPAPVGGAGERSRASRWWLVLVICVLVAAAIGAGAALALRHNNGGSGAAPGVKGGTVQTQFLSLNALNARSTVVPAGLKPVTVPSTKYDTTAGFTVDVPPGWSEKPIGLATYFYGPNDVVLDIDLTAHKFLNNMVREARHLQQQQAPPVGDTFPGYHRSYLQGVTVRGTHGAFWQFTWIYQGVRVRTDDILFVLPTAAGNQSYAVYIRAPDNGWGSKYLPMFEKILPTFAPVTTS